mgnify:CR=1 FL=1
MNGKLSKFKIAFLLFLIIGTFFILRNRTPEVYTTNSGHIFGTQYNIKYKSVEDLHKEVRAIAKRRVTGAPEAPICQRTESTSP